MRKKDRHRLITRLLSEQDIRKQEEFVEILKQRNICYSSYDFQRYKGTETDQGTGLRWRLPL